MIRPQCTKRFVIDVGHRCNMNCIFCYHHHEGDLTKAKFREFNEISNEVDNGIARGNIWCDFTGGEPTLHPSICHFVKVLSDRSIGTTIITNGVVGPTTVDKIIDSGLDEFLVSVHGMEHTHDHLTYKGVRESQLKFLEQIKGRMNIRFNFVINQLNQKEILETADWMSQWSPSIVNFINFNPLHEWKSSLKEAEDIIAGFFIVENQLNRAIGLLEQKNIGVNVRYYPMCRIAEEYRRCICNDLHVIFDPYEWDYRMPVKTVEKYIQWGIDATNETECKDYPCRDCDLQWICGGLNKKFLEIAGPECLTPQRVNFSSYEDRFNFYHYRQHNERTLKQPIRKAAI